MLDIPAELHASAVTHYQEVAHWLGEHALISCDIYPQGSFRLGTVVRPDSGNGEYDIDLVFRLSRRKEDVTQRELRDEVGRLLRGYVRWKKQHGGGEGPTGCELRRRCWTLEYPHHGFHMDVLPSIPDVEYGASGILLTDKNLQRWQHSNPIGYAHWFRGRSTELQTRLRAAAHERDVSIDEVPEWEFRTTLQRVVQVLKWHAMDFFADDPDNRPPSILITTLAAQAYAGETELFTAIQRALAGMERFVENRNGVWWVPNPAHEEENFADKWREYPERRDAFFNWRSDISSALCDAARLDGAGLPAVAARLERSFGSGPIRRAAQRYGDVMRERTASGALRMGPTGMLTTGSGLNVRSHTFYGYDSGPGN